MRNGKWSAILLVLILPAGLRAGVYPQAGVELYLGANSVVSLSPWAALRIGTSANTSLIFKFYRHSLNYDYLTDQERTAKFDAQLSNATVVYYYQKGKWDLYGAASFLIGSAQGQDYYGQALDLGAEFRPWSFLSLTAGMYLINENSTLWFPEDSIRNIFSYSLKAGLKIKILSRLILNPNVYALKNTDGALSQAYSFGLIYLPRDAVYLTAYYWRYSERTAFRFAGNYYSAGLNFYF